jgi:hypothetical protein
MLPAMQDYDYSDSQSRISDICENCADFFTIARFAKTPYVRNVSVLHLTPSGLLTDRSRNLFQTYAQLQVPTSSASPDCTHQPLLALREE